jgi:site-specific recombinase XerD
MKKIPKHYAIRRADAERVFEAHLASLAGKSRQSWHMNRRTIRSFLNATEYQNGRQDSYLHLDEAWLQRWMIWASADVPASYAMQRLGIVGRFLHALTQAGITETDLMAEFRSRHGQCSWESLVPALQSPDSKIALVALRSPAPQPGPLTPFIGPYLELHQSLGKNYNGHRHVLRGLDRFLQAECIISVQDITSTILERWMAPMTCIPAVRQRKAQSLRQFFDHLLTLKVVTNNPVSMMLLGTGKYATACKPFILTKDQISAILAAARRLPKSGYMRWKAETCYTMLALLCALGLRHGEVLHLRLRDVDLARNTLFIDQTKFHKSRYVPFGPKVRQCLEQFLEIRRTILPPFQSDDPLFVTIWRSAMSPNTLLTAFQSIVQNLGIKGAAGQRPPRLHDIRHTFAVHRLLRWYRQGADVQSRLSALATFMGHVDLKHTQVYLTATEELLQQANDRFYRQFGSLLNDEEVKS